MSKPRTIYTCQQCGAQSPKWLGKCPDCNQWNSYVEETYAAPAGGVGGLSAVRSTLIDLAATPPKPLTEIKAEAGFYIPLNMPELDRVLGGGIVPGSAVLIGGDPGIGKSTLILQALKHFVKTPLTLSSPHKGEREHVDSPLPLGEREKTVLYLSGEESAVQIKSRADRLGIAEKNLWVATENNLERIIELIKRHKPNLIAVDSVQTVFSNFIASAPGTVSQVRECAGQLITLAKQTGLTCLLVGHVTKEGSLAGPKVLEHMVDCVLYFETDHGHTHRILRSVKNRFGPANELGIFEMTGQGLKEIANPSQFFLSERSEKTAGSVVASAMEGTRPLLLEIQALVTKTSFGIPRRTAIGVDSGRVALLVAVLEKIIGLSLGDQDIFINVTGGLKVTEPAVDLAMSMAIFSSFRNLAVDPKTVFIGEVGLTGEVRAVQRPEIRVKEAAKLGFQRAFVPHHKSSAKNNVEGIALYPVKTLQDCLNTLF